MLFVRYAIAKFSFIKSLILRYFAAYGIPYLNSLQINYNLKNRYRNMATPYFVKLQRILSLFN